MPIVSIVVAAAANGVIGRDNRLPWHLPEDLAHFKRLTVGHPVIMGRRTFESIVLSLGRPLPGRHNIVLSRRPGAVPLAPTTVASLDDALAAAGSAAEVFVIGGAAVYRLALPRAERIYLTRIEADFDGDATFPPLDPAEWREISRTDHPSNAQRSLRYSFLRYDRSG